MRPRVLVISQEPVGAQMAGPAIRAYELARVLAADCAVTLAAPAPSEVGDPRVAHLPAGLADFDVLLGAVATHDVVVAQALPPRLLARVARLPARLVVDLYNPVVVEVLEATRHKPAGSRERLRRVARNAVAAHLAAADLVLCASEAQRDLWLGALAVLGLLAPEAAPGDAAARGLVAVVPFGVPAVPPRPAPAPLLKGAWPGIEPADRVLVWGGGIWDWLDAPTAIRATGLLAEHAPPVHLVFLGTRRPGIAPRDEHRAGAQAVALARALGLEGRRVHFRAGWVPYAQRGAWLREADLGVSAHPDHLEARFAFRTRILDYLWAGLPVVATGGDALSELVAAAGAGRAVPASDPAAFARACAQLLADPEPARAAAVRAAQALRWEQVAQPLVAFCLRGAKRPPTPDRRRVLRAASLAQYPALARETLATDGAAGLARRLARNAARLRA